MTTTLIAYPTTDHLYDQVCQLKKRLDERTKEKQGPVATTLMEEATEDLLNFFYYDLFEQLKAAETEPRHAYREASAIIREIRDKLLHYLGWVSPFFGNDKLPPAVAHYAQLFQNLPAHPGAGDTAGWHLVVPIDQALHQQAQQLQQALAEGRVTDLETCVRVMKAINGTVLHTLLFVPKDLMKFNFVVSKTLGGVLGLMETMTARALEKALLAMPPEHQPILARQMARFLVDVSAR